MPEREVWTLKGRKKIYLVGDDNAIVEELEDKGALSEIGNQVGEVWLRDALQ